MEPQETQVGIVSPRPLDWQTVMGTVVLHGVVFAYLIGTLGFILPPMLDALEYTPPGLPAGTQAAVAVLQFVRQCWFAVLPAVLGLDAGAGLLVQRFNPRARRTWAVAGFILPGAAAFLLSLPVLSATFAC